MTVKEAVIDALATKPCRALPTLLENNRIGTIALNQSATLDVYSSHSKRGGELRNVSPMRGTIIPTTCGSRLDWLERCVLSFSFTGMRFTFVTVQY